MRNRPLSRRLPASLFLTLCAWLACASAWAASAQESVVAGTPAPADLSTLVAGADIYQQACQACHGADGKGSPLERVGFDTPLPDFTECSFASREASADWIGIAHEGGPLRGFSRMMPAFGKALSLDQLAAAVAHIHTFCTEPQWPRGEFNLPRPLVTGKAYLEDEAVMTSSFSPEGLNSFETELVWEKRFGARSELELKLPFGWQEDGGGGTTTGIGDVAAELKHVLYDNLDSGSIVSLAGELVLPTGDAAKGFGKDTAVFETSLLYGQILPADAFFQTHVGFEFPVDTDKAENEMFWRTALGRSFQEPNWGRTWTPMVELLGARELEGGGTEWDLVPQLNVTLSKRQHIQISLGARVPLTDSSERSTVFMMYFMWDWYDGGLLEGW
jgi:hypothetical protein